MAKSLPQSLDGLSLNLAARSGSEALAELHASLAGSDALVDPSMFLKELFERQRAGVSCIDSTVALPHVRTSAVNRIVFAAGRSSAGIFFDEHYSSIRLVILVGVPTDAVDEYLRWTAHLARTLRGPGMRDALLKAPDADAFSAVWSLCLPKAKR